MSTHICKKINIFLVFKIRHTGNFAVDLTADLLCSVHGQIESLGNGLNARSLASHLEQADLVADKVAPLPEELQFRLCDIGYNQCAPLPCMNHILFI